MVTNFVPPIAALRLAGAALIAAGLGLGGVPVPTPAAAAQGTAAQGTAAQSIVAQSIVAQGIVAQGIAAQGIAAQGSVAQGATLAQAPATRQGNAAPQGNAVPQGNAAPQGPVVARAGLLAALDRASGGETIALAPGDYGRLSIGPKGQVRGDFDAPVTLVSADPSDPARLSGLRLDGARNLVFDDLSVVYTAEPGHGHHYRLVHITDSRAITFRNSRFFGDDAISEDPVVDGFPSGFGIWVNASEAITVTGARITGFWKGIAFVNSRDVVLDDSELTDLRSDGLNLGTVNGATITNNHFHGFALSPGSGDHPDMIQLFERPETPSQASRGVTITGNLLDIGEGGWTQSIFMPNKTADRFGKGVDFAFHDFTIAENVIVNDHVHGIRVGATDGLVVRNNTLLRSVDPRTQADRNDNSPRIYISNLSRDVVIDRNVAQFITEVPQGRDWQRTDNVAVQDTAPDQPGYYGDILLDPSDLTNAPGNLTVLPGTEIHRLRAGATRLLYDPTPPALRAIARSHGAGGRYQFDGGLSAGPEGLAAETGATFAWDFGDGTTGRGVDVSHVYADGGQYRVTLTVTLPDGQRDTFAFDRPVEGAAILGFDPAAGDIMALSGGTARPLGLDPPLAASGRAIAIGRRATVVPAEAMAPVSGAAGLDLTLRLKATRAGEVLKIPGLLMASLTREGEIAATLVDGGRNRQLTTSGAGLADRTWHDVRLSYDAASGLTVSVDGTQRGRLATIGAVALHDGAALHLGGAGPAGAAGAIGALTLSAGRD